MSGAPKLRSMNVADSEARPVLGPAGNKAGSLSARKPASKPLRRVEKSPVEITVAEKKKALPSSTVNSLPSVLRRPEQLLHSNLSLNASCSSDASADSFHSQASTGRLIRSNSVGSRRKPYASRPSSIVSDDGLDSPPDGSHLKKRCAWVTPNADPSYAAFHDEEWGVPVHDDKEVFVDFDPLAVSKLNENKLMAPGSMASSLLSELKLRAIIENALQISKVIDEFGSFNEYIWSFVNHRPIISRFRYPRQVPVKTPKADVISKDLVRRGFRSVGPTVIYSFMQVAGITNDHLTTCFRFQECIIAAEGKVENGIKDIPEEKKTDNVIESELSIAIDELSFSLK
ncbi:uncharacterized protein LOC111299364 isoform X2 [Durio zibethinus]|uniref:Uncharacterized protein LOC111299364 isoform X2 n=1 Tax=Durio zibethinus TaxID=66656 RepID=A0A6P5ZBM5_DURZI|nr:uncharacterized protein LOC111299364 isoform X2 [Durio zibethinus]